MVKVTKDSIISDVLESNPNAIEVFMKHGFHCLGCALANKETIEQGAESHGIDVEKLLKDLNKK